MATPTIPCKRYKGGSVHWDHTPDADMAAGDVHDFGNVVGIAEVPIESGVLGALAMDGSFTVPKKTGEEWSAGDEISWDADSATFSLTSNGYGEAVAGLARADAATGDATGIVELTLGVARS